MARRCPARPEIVYLRVELEDGHLVLAGRAPPGLRPRSVPPPEPFIALRVLPVVDVNVEPNLTAVPVGEIENRLFVGQAP